MTGPGDLERVRERVRARYAQAAVVVADGGVPTCADSSGGAVETGTGAACIPMLSRAKCPSWLLRPVLAAAIRSLSLTLRTVRRFLILGRGAASTCCCPLAGSGQLIDL